ncbi:MAG TPA: hypothetical protein DD417_13450 [Elusimicrobia bacterium]|nr:hypothetical protein [Elusimicrobiota bacterium]
MSPSVLELRGVGFPGNARSNLQGVDLTVAAGEAVVLFGHSGSGKSTLIKIAGGLVVPPAGTVSIPDPRPSPKLSLSYVFQKGGLLNNLSLLQNAILPVVYHGLMPREEARERALALFTELGIAGDAERFPAVVGSDARIFTQMTRALLAEPRLLLLDEIFLSVNAAGDRVLSGLIERVRREGRMGVLVASSELSPCLGWADRFIFMRRGGSVEFRGREELLAAQDPKIRDFLD